MLQESAMFINDSCSIPALCEANASRCPSSTSAAAGTAALVLLGQRLAFASQSAGMLQESLMNMADSCSILAERGDAAGVGHVHQRLPGVRQARAALGFR